MSDSRHVDAGRLRIPPLDLIRRLQAGLMDRGLPSVVGGSALLASLGLVQMVNDWDLMTDGEPTTVAETLHALGLQYRPVPPTSPFRTERLLVVPADGYTIDVMVRLALATPSGVVSIPARPGRRWRGLQLADDADWELAYRLMGRADKADLLRRHLQSQ